jgi:hypothetical protein
VLIPVLCVGWKSEEIKTGNGQTIANWRSLSAEAVQELAAWYVLRGGQVSLAPVILPDS